MRIAHVSVGAPPAVFSTWGGAIQRRIAALSIEQVKQGHYVTVVSPSGAGESPANVQGVHTRYVDLRTPRPFDHIEFQMKAIRALRDEISEHDVVHFHSEPEAALLGRGLKGKTALTYDNFYFRRGKKQPLFPVYKRALRRFDLLLPCSQYCAAESGRYWSLPDEKVHVVYNGVDTSLYKPDSAGAERERAILGIGGPMILYLGRVCQQKGSDTLLEAFSNVKRELPTANLVIAGPIETFGGKSKDEELWLRRFAVDGVQYLGAVQDARVPDLLNAADVFAMPTSELEMFGMAAVEALACGTPVVASDHGGLRETVPEECGARFETRNSRALANELLLLLGDTERRLECGRRGREHAKTFSWQRIVAKLDDLYES